MTTNFGHDFHLVHHYSGYQAQVVTCHTEVTRGHWTLHVNKLRHGPIFTGLVSFHVLWLDKTKSQLYVFCQRSRKGHWRVKRSISLKMLLVLQTKDPGPRSIYRSPWQYSLQWQPKVTSLDSVLGGICKGWVASATKDHQIWSVELLNHAP